ncbi:hypothetical protein [Klebsiella pneumoniae]|uniref:hypothetical protein n=1 Tax=Klebsiella pneumoniae TaxID=573 RepID=UPI0018DF7175|nr:hypothetical protein [Klebsiella pneumoniae]
MTKMNNPKFTTPSGDTAPRQVWQQTVDAVLAQTKSQAAGLSSADAAERLRATPRHGRSGSRPLTQCWRRPKARPLG